MIRRLFTVFAMVALGPLGGCTPEKKPASLILATTTSIEGSGLLPVLVREFQRDSGIMLQPLVVGSGKALQLCRQRQADVAITHDAELERQFVAAGHAAESRQFMWNEFVMAGPAEDPAGVRSASSAAEAFRRIGDTRAKFCSRGDSSGTHARELKIWKAAGVDPAKNPNYLVTGQPMAALLRTAGDSGAYALTDRATFDQLRRAVELELLLSGDPALRNVYAVTVAKEAENAAAAREFAQWISRGRGVEVIRQFRINGNRAFHLMGERAAGE